MSKRMTVEQCHRYIDTLKEEQRQLSRRVTQLEAQLGCAQTSELSSFRIAIPISCLPLRLQYLLVRTEPLALFPHQPSLGNDIYVNYIAPYLEEKTETAWLMVQRYCFRVWRLWMTWRSNGFFPLPGRCRDALPGVSLLMFRPSTAAGLFNLDAVKLIEAQSNSIEEYLECVLVVPSPAKLDSTTTLHEMQSRILAQLPASARKMAWIPDPLGGGAPSEAWQRRSRYCMCVGQLSISFYMYRIWLQQWDLLAVVADDYHGGGPWKLSITDQHISTSPALSHNANRR
jgi:hypothetical protein